jgi:hypothetical protein
VRLQLLAVIIPSGLVMAIKLLPLVRVMTGSPQVMGMIQLTQVQVIISSGLAGERRI